MNKVESEHATVNGVDKWGELIHPSSVSKDDNNDDIASSAISWHLLNKSTPLE